MQDHGGMVEEAPVANSTEHSQTRTVHSGNVLFEAAAAAVGLTAHAALEIDLLGMRA